MHWAERDHEVHQPGRREYLRRALRVLHLTQRARKVTGQTAPLATLHPQGHANLAPEGIAGSGVPAGPQCIGISLSAFPSVLQAIRPKRFRGLE